MAARNIAQESKATSLSPAHTNTGETEMRALLIAALCVLAFALTTPAATAQMGGGGMSSSGPAGPDRAAYERGVTAYQANDYEAAIRHLRAARRPAPDHGGVNYVLGMSYLGIGDKEQARDAFAHAVRDRSAPPDAWLQLGLLALEAGDRNSAVNQQEALQRQLNRCNSNCDADRRTNLQRAYDQLSQRLAAAP
jgi:tetratricopeptide (TPR) repeat protein